MGLIVIYFVILFVSSLRIRFDDHYFKDDYRTTVEKTLELATPGHTIYWSGARVPASYYGLEFQKIEMPKKWISKQQAVYVSNYRLSEIEKAISNSTKDIFFVMSNKYDLFDKNHGWIDFIKVNSLESVFETQDFISFEIAKQ